MFQTPFPRCTAKGDIRSDVGKPERWEPQETFNKSTIYHLKFGLKSVSCVYISKVVFFNAM